MGVWIIGLGVSGKKQIDYQKPYRYRNRQDAVFNTHQETIRNVTAQPFGDLVA